MAIDPTEILTAALADWGETVTVITTQITAIFDRDFVEPSLFGQGLESRGPQIACKTADLPAGTTHGSAVTVRSVSYTVSGIEDNGLGETILSLRASA